jgi:glutathione S-transferase
MQVCIYIDFEPLQVDEARANQLLADAADFFSEVFGNKPGDRINKWIGYIDEKLGEQQFFMGSTPNAVDFSFYSVFNLIKAKQNAGKAKDYTISPNLEGWVARVEAVPAVAEMLAEHDILPAAYL